MCKWGVTKKTFGHKKEEKLQMWDMGESGRVSTRGLICGDGTQATPSCAI
jgi:hypothetical protein